MHRDIGPMMFRIADSEHARAVDRLRGLRAEDFRRQQLALAGGFGGVDEIGDLGGSGD